MLKLLQLLGSEEVARCLSVLGVMTWLMADFSSFSGAGPRSPKSPAWPCGNIAWGSSPPNKLKLAIGQRRPPSATVSMRATDLPPISIRVERRVSSYNCYAGWIVQRQS